jgi:PAS domain S-box-containing protein
MVEPIRYPPEDRGPSSSESAKALLASIVEFSKDAIISVTVDSVVTSWNKAAELIYGFPAEEVTGRPLTSLTLPKDLQQVLGRLKRIAQSKDVELFKSESQRRNGSAMWLSVQMSPIKDEVGDIVGISIIARDITEVKKVEEALQASEKRFRALLTASSGVIYRMSPDWEVMHHLDVRNSAENVTAPSSGWLLKFICQEDRRSVMAFIRKAVRKKSVYELEHRFLHTDGKVGWASSRAVPILNSEGEILEWFGAASDISERKNAEEQLLGLSRTLKQRVAELQERTVQLQTLAAKIGSIEQRERKRFAALLHDDLQQLLVAARIQLGELASVLTDESVRRPVQLVSSWIGEALNVGRSLTRQLRPPALYEDGLVPALHGLVEQMMARHHLRVELQATAIERDLSDDIKALLFDSIRELLFNVSKHADVDSATLEVEEGSDCVRVIVRDLGAGIPTEMDFANSGFGIFSIQERLAAFGGSMSIVSLAGEGTRVVLEAPFLETTEPLHREQVSSASGGNRPLTNGTGKSGIRILIVDDHAMVREGLVQVLAADLRVNVVAEAADGREGIKAVALHRPDVVLLDLNMPNMNGIEAAREISRDWPESLIIGLSVQDDDVTAKSMLDAGASAFFSKAGSSEHLIATIVDLAGTKEKKPP